MTKRSMLRSMGGSTWPGSICRTLLNTYPDTQYQMRAKLAIADSWYREGGTAALTQAEQEYKDFITSSFRMFPRQPKPRCAWATFTSARWTSPTATTPRLSMQSRSIGRCCSSFRIRRSFPDAKQRLRGGAGGCWRIVRVPLRRSIRLIQTGPATIARYQTVVDTYPQYSHMDDALIGLGDGYEGRSQVCSRASNCLRRARLGLEKIYDDQAIAAYSKVVMEHAASKDVEDARDRLAAMHVSMPKPTAEQLAPASEALENSRAQYPADGPGEAPGLPYAGRGHCSEDGRPDPRGSEGDRGSGHLRKKIVKDFQLAMNPDGGAKPAAVEDAGVAAPVTDGFW